MTRRRASVQGTIPRLPRVGVSACLAGAPVRWDGRDKLDATLLDAFRDRVEWVPVCPEVELGLGVPREPIRLEGDPHHPRLVAPGSGRDLTGPMRDLARTRIAAIAAEGIAGYVLKARSPSCGLTDVPVVRRGAERPGRGLFAQMLVEQLPGLPVAEEDDLRSAAARARFLARVQAYARALRR